MPNTLPNGKPGGKVGERPLRRHALAFCTALALVFAFNLLTQAAWWLLWPILAWGTALMAHWLYVQTINVDDDWVEERTLDVRRNAYDFGHIGDIVSRHDDKPENKPQNKAPPRPNQRR